MTPDEARIHADELYEQADDLWDTLLEEGKGSSASDPRAIRATVIQQQADDWYVWADQQEAALGEMLYQDDEIFF